MQAATCAGASSCAGALSCASGELRRRWVAQAASVQAVNCAGGEVCRLICATLGSSTISLIIYLHWI